MERFKNRRVATSGIALAVLLGAAAAATAVARAMPGPPAAPDPPMVVDLGGGVAEVSWTDVELEDGYDVQREKQRGSGAWFKTKIVATVAADVTSIEDDAGTDTYRYRVRAFNVDGDSGWSGWTEVTLTDGGGDPPPPEDVWIAWYVYPPEFTPIAPVVENMGPAFECVFNAGTRAAARTLELLAQEDGGGLITASRWPDFGDDPHPCPTCANCGVTVTPTDVCTDGAATFPLDVNHTFHLESDSLGNIWYDFRASGDPPGPKKSKRFQSELVPVRNIVWDDPADKENSNFTLEIREPCVMLDPQTGPSDPRYISIGDIRFEKWGAP
jgi:hypothetical protein